MYQLNVLHSMLCNTCSTLNSVIQPEHFQLSLHCGECCVLHLRSLMLNSTHLFHFDCKNLKQKETQYVRRGDCQGVSRDDLTMHTTGIPPSEGSHACVVGEGAHILFPEPVQSHFNPPTSPSSPWAEVKQKLPPPACPPFCGEQCYCDRVASLLEIDCE